VRKTTVAARFANIEVEIRGAPARKLRDRLWDDDARSPTDNERGALVSTTGRVGLTEVKLFKTEAFLESRRLEMYRQPLAPTGRSTFSIPTASCVLQYASGDPVPALWPRPLRGLTDRWFLDVSLIFARDSQIYLLALSDGLATEAIQARAREAFVIYASGADGRFRPVTRRWSLTTSLLLTSLCVRAGPVHERTAAVDQLNTRGLGNLHQDVDREYTRMTAHSAKCLEYEHFKPDLTPYVCKLLAAASLKQGKTHRSLARG
jgi:elongation factor 1-gamma